MTVEAKGRLTLKGSRAPKAVLQNFKLMRDGKLTNAAILLFAKDPRRFFNNIQVHCLHFFGTEKRKPIASQQPYEGRIFEVIDQAVEFVLGKLDRPVGTRAQSTQAPGDFEVPRSVIKGTTGKGTHYVLDRKRTTNAPNAPQGILSPGIGHLSDISAIQPDTNPS